MKLSSYKVKRTYRKDGDTEIIENEIEEGIMPLFVIDLPDRANNIWIYYRKSFCDYTPKGKAKELDNKEQIIQTVKKELGIKVENS